MLQTFKTVRERVSDIALAPVVAIAATLVSAKMAMAAAAGGGNANIRGALETNQDALTAVEDSTFTGDGVEEAAQNTTNAVLFTLGAVGIIMTAWGIWKLWKISKRWELCLHDSDRHLGPGSHAVKATLPCSGRQHTGPTDGLDAALNPQQS